MTISNSTTTFANKKVVQYDASLPYDPSPDIVYRLSLEYDDEGKMDDLIASFLGKADKPALSAEDKQLCVDGLKHGDGLMVGQVLQVVRGDGNA